MTKQLTDAQLKKIHEFFMEFLEKQQEILDNQDLELKKILKNYLTRLEAAEDKGESLEEMLDKID